MGPMGQAHVRAQPLQGRTKKWLATHSDWFTDQRRCAMLPRDPPKAGRGRRAATNLRATLR